MGKALKLFIITALTISSYDLQAIRVRDNYKYKSQRERYILPKEKKKKKSTWRLEKRPFFNRYSSSSSRPLKNDPRKENRWIKKKSSEPKAVENKTKTNSSFSSRLLNPQKKAVVSPKEKMQSAPIEKKPFFSSFRRNRTEKATAPKQTEDRRSFSSRVLNRQKEANTTSSKPTTRLFSSSSRNSSRMERSNYVSPVQDFKRRTDHSSRKKQSFLERIFYPRDRMEGKVEVKDRKELRSDFKDHSQKQSFFTSTRSKEKHNSGSGFFSKLFSKKSKTKENKIKKRNRMKNPWRLP